jgi:RNA polymerase sigma-70 factor (ECF subfamily)
LNDIAKAATHGDQPEIRNLLQAIASSVRRTCRGILGSVHPDLEDAIQDSLIGVVHALGAWRAEADFSSYVAKITFRVAIDYKRRSRRRERLDAGEIEQLTDSAGDPGKHEGEGERRAMLLGLIHELSPPQAESLLLRFILGYSLEETASIMDVSMNTAKTRIRLGKNALRRKLQRSRRASKLYSIQVRHDDVR